MAIEPPRDDLLSLPPLPHEPTLRDVHHGLDDASADDFHIRSVGVEEHAGRRWVVVATNAGRGFCPVLSRLDDARSLFDRLVAPVAVGLDARNVPSLVARLYRHGRNYKYTGLPLWVSIGHAEIAVLDLLGRVSGRSVPEMLGGRRREAVDVYLSRFNRGRTAEEEMRQVIDELDRSGQRAVKFKVGGRMAGSDDTIRDDLLLLEHATDLLAGRAIIIVDANGSYTREQATLLGRELERLGVAIFEEPCPWEDFEATAAVADALEMPVAGGEQDSSWPKWRWMARRRGVDVLQPDVYYNGGLLRALAVADLAASHGLTVMPHSPRTGDDARPHLALLSLLDNPAEFHEYRDAAEIEAGRVTIPTGPGFGFSVDG